MTDLQQLKSSFNVKEYLEDINVDYRTEGDNVSNGWCNIEECPFCGDEAYHLGIHYESGNNFHCWKCGDWGDAISLIQALESISFSVAKLRLEQYQSGVYLEAKERERRSYTQILPTGFEKIEFGQEPQVVIDYFTRRRFDLSLCQKYGLGFCRRGEYQLRMIVPIYLDRELMSFQAMDVTGKARVPYIDCPEDRALVPNKQLLYGIDTVPGDQVLIVEGVTDKWRIGDSAVAMFTKNWTRAQILLLYDRARGKRVKVLLDMDALRDAEGLAKELTAMFRDVTFVEYGEDDPKDPALFSDEQIKNILF